MGKISILIAAGLLIGLFASSIFGPIPEAVAFEKTIRAIANEQERAILLQDMKDRFADQAIERSIRLKTLEYELRMRAEGQRNFWTILAYGLVAVAILLVTGIFALRIARTIIGAPQPAAPPGRDASLEETQPLRHAPNGEIVYRQPPYQQPARIYQQTAWEEERERRLRRDTMTKLAATEANFRREEGDYSKQPVPKRNFEHSPVQHSKADGNRQESIKAYRRVKP